MFRVIWIQQAVNELAAVWLAADVDLRKQITKASHIIDQFLQINPQNVGESRSEGKRIAFFPPLALTFKVDEKRNEVTVVHVWVMRKRKRS